MHTPISVNELQRELASARPPVLVDVRRAAAFAQADAMLAGAVWHDPAEVDDWGQTLAAQRAVVVYCVHGHEVSQGCAARLAERRDGVRFLEGGFEAWRAAGGALVPR
jgi:rhodanese-related sulfurtransferase